jgi:quercetin dioxygenase-like cupin family protein
VVRIALVLVVLVLTAFAEPAAAEGQRVVIARAHVAGLPAGDLVVRFLELSVPAGQAAVSHGHGAGFTYAAEGAHVFSVGGRDAVLSPGQAAWVGAQEMHTHGGLGGAASRFWFVLVGPAASRGTPPTWPYASARVVGESDPFQVAPGAHELLLSEVRLAQPADALGGLAADGPTGLAVLDGQARLGGTLRAAGGVALLKAGDASSVANAAPGPTRLLAFTVASAAAPAQLPRTGQPPLLTLAGLSAAAVAAAALLRRAGARRTS